MLINCYYYAPHNHELLTRHLDWDLEKMASLGTDVVSVCVQESQLTNWHQQRLRNVVDRAHRFGLKVHAVPNRWCGMLAGWIDGYAAWFVEHPELRLPGEALFGDPRQPAVRRHFEENLRRMLGDFAFDGVIWDEPRPPTEDVIHFLDEMSAACKAIRHDVVTTLFAEAGNVHLADVLARTRHTDYLGVDGHIRSEAHVMHRMKNTIFTTHAAFDPPLQAAGKKRFYLLEAQRHRDADLDDYLANVERAFALPMDHLMYYYSAHEMTPDKADVFDEATWRAVAGAARRRAKGRTE